MKIAPITLRAAQSFIDQYHRHNKPPRGHKFSIGLKNAAGELIGVATAGRPVARHFDDGLTLEVNRTCTTGERNANSALYGAVWRAAKAMGYVRCITYTQGDESGASIRAAGFIKVKDIPARKSWSESSVKLKEKRDAIGSGGVNRVLWEIRAAGFKIEGDITPIVIEPAPAEPLKRCAAARDGECHHAECPQLRDNEPKATGRHCPIDNWDDE